jgi:hypothetical protein
MNLMSQGINIKQTLKQYLGEIKGLMSRDTWSFVYFLITSGVKKSHREGKEGQVLIEFTPMAQLIVCIFLLIRVLKKKYNNPDLVAFTFDSRTKYFIEKRLLYWAMGIRLVVFDCRDYLSLADAKLNEIWSKNSSKEQIVDLKVDGILIGDLIYDEHLIKNRVATIELGSSELFETMRMGLSRYFLLREYFRKSDIVAVYNTHQCYLQGIPLRIASNKGIDVFSLNQSEVQRFSEKRLWDNADRLRYRYIFNQLSDDVKEKGLDWAEGRIGERMAGKVGVDMRYSTRSAFVRKESNERVIRDSKKIKVLIAAHCFFDAANGSGKNIFPDFFEWIKFLGDISTRTDYDWYIKTHPDYLPGNNEIAKELIAPYPKIQWVPNETSHLQLVDEGVDFLLTVYGTVGFEYAALGVTVINASVTNPHINYGFNIHPRTREEYSEILLNLSREVKLEIDIKEVYEYYFMRHCYFNTEDWLISNYEHFMSEEGYYALFNRSFFCYFLEDRKRNQERSKKIEESLSAFVNSNRARMTRFDVEGDNWIPKMVS